MRLWYFELLPYLDDFHLVSQWRELLAIKGAIEKNGSPNHRLVNKVLDYTLGEFKAYCSKVLCELDKRGIKTQKAKRNEIWSWYSDKFKGEDFIEKDTLFEGWHDDRYLRQCYFNLEEKHDCGIVSDEAWGKIEEFYKERIKE